MKAPNPESKLKTESGADAGQRSRLLREFFLNASLLAAMKETVEEAVFLDCLEQAVARDEHEKISAPAA